MKSIPLFLSKWRGQLLLLAFLCSGLAVWASDCDFEVNNICYNFLGADDEVAVTYREYDGGRYGDGYSSHYTGSVTVPASVTYSGKTYRVTAVGSSAFRECYSLTAVNLPSTITSIGSYAFADCSSLTTITLPQTVRTIGACAFDGCVNLSSVTIPAGVTTIGSNAFTDCRNLYSLTIPSTVENIGVNAFSATGWYNNQSDGVVYAGKVAYKYKGTMPEGTTITLKNDTRGIAGSAFSGFSNLVNISIPNSVTTIGGSAFYGCSGLTSVTIPSSVTSIGSSTFYNCSGLTSVTIPSSVTSIGSSTFYNCSGLTSVTIPNSVTSIGGSAFYNCSGLTSVNIPNSMKSIESSAFYGTGIFTNSPDGVFYVDNWVCGYKGEKPTGNLILNEDTRGISSSAFYNCSGLTSVTIPNSVTSIGGSAFYNCSGLTSVTIPNSVTSFGSSAFYNCSGLTSVTIPNSVKSIGYSAFYNCSGLTSVNIPNSVTSIGSLAFLGCSNLTSITVERQEPPCTDSSIFSTYSSATLYVPYGSKAAYQGASYWKNFTNIVEIVYPTDISTMNDAIYANEATGFKGGDATLSICMKNSQATNAYSFDLVLPVGVTVDSYTLSDRHNGHAETMNRNEGTGVYSFAVLSLQSKDVKGNEGVIWTLKLRVPEDIAEGEHEVKIQNAKYSLTSGSTSVSLSETISRLTVVAYPKGDANGDNSVDIADAVCIVNHVVGKATPSFVEAAADANADGAVDIADAVRIVNLVVGKISALSRQQEISLPEPE